MESFIIWNSFGVVCKSIELNDHWSASSNRPNLPAGIKPRHTKVKHLPWFILYRHISKSSLEVWLAIDLAVLLGDDRWSRWDLLCALCRSRRPWVRHGCCSTWGIGSRRQSWWVRGFRRRSSWTWGGRSSPVICCPTTCLLTTSPTLILPWGLSSRTAWIGPIGVPPMSSVPVAAALKRLMAILPTVPTFNGRLKDGLLLAITFAFGGTLNGIKTSVVSLSSFSRPCLWGPRHWEFRNIWGRRFFCEWKLWALHIVILLIPLSLGEINQIEETILGSLLVDW